MAMYLIIFAAGFLSFPFATWGYRKLTGKVTGT